MNDSRNFNLGNYKMAAESAGSLMLLKTFGLKAVLGMLGAAMLYMVLPPVKLTPEGKREFDEREFVLRLACAGIVSALCGDLAVAMLASWWPSIPFADHRGAVYLIVGAPAWWITRAVALWLQRNDGKDIEEVARKLKERT